MCRRLLVLIVTLEALMIARIVIGLILFCLTLSNANAASILMRTYKSPIDKADKALLKVYFDGVKEGIVMLNVMLQLEGRQPLFCQPENLALTVEQAEEILMRKAKKMANPDKVPVSIILIQGLQDTFPCDEKH
jgi:Rap1a immunity proteins